MWNMNDESREIMVMARKKRQKPALNAVTSVRTHIRTRANALSHKHVVTDLVACDAITAVRQYIESDCRKMVWIR
jgi:hypothetical protein